MSAPEWLLSAPVVTVVIMAIALVMSIVIQSTNRVVINHFIGLDNYRSMQRELSEFRKESMNAARSQDPKQLERIKKKQSQINAMQAKMMKPQMIQMALSFCYLPLWYFVLTPVFGGVTVAYLPGFELPLFVWYMVSSLFFGTLVMKAFGTTPNM
ncbi:MAG: EMC3/TMCO1 family protein [Nitrososphaerota archaeon]|jgi:uncharacterized membrane protein (DUF106 family)|nr:EMC3/TMCO1 family protein [Nitrososphaerota archaeon]